MIVVTGAAGFIGSCLVGKLNAEGYKDIIVVDNRLQAKRIEALLTSLPRYNGCFTIWYGYLFTIVHLQIKCMVMAHMF